nr:helix-turn-helix domain-containing protein [Methylobacterium sp. ZNC0032]
MNIPKNWQPSDAGPGRALADIRQVEWSDAESFRREKAGWLRAIRRVGDLRLANMVWLLMVLGDYMKPQNEAAWPGIARLAADLGWSLASVKRAIALAIAWGWIIRDRRYATSNRYLMSFSVSVRADVEQRHGLRLQPFLDRLGSGIKPELRYLKKIPETDNQEEYLTDPLGEPVPDEALRHPEISISDLHRALGDGDINLGQHRAARLGRSRIEYLRMQVAELGLHRAAPQIRDAACDADQAELSAQSRRGSA